MIGKPSLIRKYLNRDLKEVREQTGHLREEFQAGGNGKCKSPEEGHFAGCSKKACVAKAG